MNGYGMIWDFDPFVARVGPFGLPYYTLLFGLGLLLAYATGRAFARRGAIALEHVNPLAVYLLVSIIVLAHLVHLIFYEPRAFVEQPWRLLEVGVGLASHGGALGAVVALAWFCHRKEVSLLRYADVCAVAALWLAPTIRLGNFLNSELIGTPTDLPWGVIFLRAHYLEPRHPSQLYEAMIGAALVVVFLPWATRRITTTPPGTFFHRVLLAYFTSRFLVEYVKAHQVLADTFPLSMGQLLSLPMIGWSLVWLLRHPRGNRQQ